jgi:hypothetical protein
MRSSPYGGVSHGHADQNAYVIEAFGHGLAIATGYYPWYGSPHHHRWTRSTRAVNSILVDGQGQVPRRWDAQGELTGFRSVPGFDYAEGEAAPAYRGRLQRFRRHVVHVRPGVFVIYDDLRAERPALYQWLLHAYHEIQIDRSQRLLRVENPPAAMDVHLLWPRDVAFTQTDQYDPEPESTQRRWSNTWHLTASTATPSESGRFLAVLLPHRDGDRNDLPRVAVVEGQGAIGVRLSSSAGGEHLVAFRTDPEAKTVSCGGLQSASNVFARHRDQHGQVDRRFEFPAD